LISEIWVFRHPKSIERTSQDSQIGRGEKKRVWGYKCVGWVCFVAKEMRFKHKWVGEGAECSP
jgi:hypothetical protein